MADNDWTHELVSSPWPLRTPGMRCRIIRPSRQREIQYPFAGREEP